MERVAQPRGLPAWPLGWARAGRARPDYGALGLYALALVATGAVLLPIGVTLVASLREGLLTDGGPWALTNFQTVVTHPRFGQVVGNTLALGLGTVAVMLAIAVPLTWLVARSDLPGRGLVYTLLVAQVAIPSFLTAMAYVFLLNPRNGMVNLWLKGLLGVAAPIFNVQSVAWMAALQGIVLVPAAVFMMLAAFAAMDPTLEEAAAVSGLPRAQILLRVVCPMLLPSILAAGLFFFVIAVEIFDFAGIIGMPADIFVVSSWIYDLTHPSTGLPLYGPASSVGVLLMAITVPAVVLYLWATRSAGRYVTVTGKRVRARPLPLGRWRWPALAFVGAYFSLSFAIPALTLFWASVVPYLQPPSAAALGRASFQSYAYALSFFGTPLKNTLLLMVATATLACALSLCVSWVVTRSRLPGRRVLDGVVFLAPAIPALIGAVAFMYVALSIYRVAPLYGTIWLIVLALAVRALAFTSRTLNGAAIQLHPELDEAARVSGLPTLASFRRIFVPLVAPALVYAWTWVAVLAARDLTTPIMLYARDNPTVATLIFNLQANGKSDQAAAVAVLLMGVLIVVSIVARRLARGYLAA